MSDYKRLTKNPETGLFETATWRDNYFGQHNYGVIFDSHPDVVFDPRDEPLETKDMASTGITNAVGYNKTNMNKYIKGQTLTDKDGNKRKVLEVLGDLVFISDYNLHNVNSFNHYKEIDQNYTVEQEKWKPSNLENYWFPDITTYEKVCRCSWVDNSSDKQKLALNLVFKTKEEALARYSEIIKLIS